MTQTADALPRGFVARTDGVAIRPKLFWALFAWFGVAVGFGVLAVGTALLAVRLGRTAWVVDSTGLRKLNWRRASVRWDRVSNIELKRTGRYWQVWVHAPAAVELPSGGKSRDRMILPAKILAPHPQHLCDYLTQQWQAGKHLP